VDGIWLSVALIPLIMCAVWLSVPLLGVLGINGAVLESTTRYIWALNWSTIPLLVFFALRRYLQAVQIVWPILFTLVSANLINIAANWVLVFGNLGAPRLGVEGSGWATCLSRVYMCAALWVTLLWRDRKAVSEFRRPSLSGIRKLLHLGLPASAQIGFEWGVYTVATMLIARLSADVLAAHQIVLMTVSTTYMMPLGISSAAAVRVGHAIGRRDAAGAARAGWTGLGLGAIAMSGAALLLLLAPRMIARLFTPDPAVVETAVPILRVGAVFQLFDGSQVVAIGALRGAGNTRIAAICHLFGYWIVGLPLGLVLAFQANLGALGLWSGLAAALVGIGSVLLFQWARVSRGFTARLR
jgi:MATE family multidrug resistance protein